MLSGVDWGELFAFEKPILEIFLRGTIVYLLLFTVLRVVLKRQMGAVGITDLLVVILLADAAQNAMAGDYKTIPDGILLVSTMVFWSYLLDWMGYRFAWFQRLVQSPPLPLVEDGELLHKNMRRELITRDELMSQLREQGVDDVADVKTAHMEGNGHISVVTKEGVDEGGRRSPAERPVG